MGAHTASLRPRHLITADIVKQLGGKQAVGRRLGKSEETVKKHCQLPEDAGGSGREPTVRDVIEILGQTAEEPLNSTLRNLAREMIEHFTVPANIELRTEDPVEEIRYTLRLLENRVSHIAATVNVHCPECGDRLMAKSFINGVPQFVCEGTRH